MMKRFAFPLLLTGLLLALSACHHDKDQKERPVKIYDPYKDAPGRVVMNTYPNSDQPCDVYIYKVDSAGHKTDELLCHAGYHKNGSLYAEKKYQNGIAEGIWNAYYEDGTLWSTETFRNGVQVGEEKTFYENGQLRTFCTYDNGEINGEMREYYMSGKLQKKCNFEHGVLVGDYKELYENGKVSVVGHFTAGICSGEWIKYAADGSVSKTMTADEQTVVCGTCPKCAALRKAALAH